MPHPPDSPRPRPVFQLLQQKLPSIFLNRHEHNPFYAGTIGLCTAISGLDFLIDAKVHVAHLGGNRFGIQTALEDQASFADHMKLSQQNVSQGRYYTILTSVFNHDNMLHLVGNLWGLYNVGRRLRPLPFTIVFYGGAVVGNLICLALDMRLDRGFGWRSKGSTGMGVYLGASGGVAALMAFMSCLLPNVQVTMYSPFPLMLPFWMHTVAFAAYSFWAELSSVDEDIAHLGHLGGLLWGMSYYVIKFRRLPWI